MADSSAKRATNVTKTFGFSAKKSWNGGFRLGLGNVRSRLRAFPCACRRRGVARQFNERIADYTQKALRDRDKETLVANVGAKINTCLQTRGYNPDVSFNLPSSVTGITSIVEQIVLTLENWREQEQIDRIDLIYNSIDSGTNYHPR